MARRKHHEDIDDDAPRGQGHSDAGEALGDKPNEPSSDELRANESVRNAQEGTSIAGANSGTSVADTPKDDVPDDIEGAVASQVEADPEASKDAGGDVADPNDVTSFAGANSGTSVGASKPDGVPDEYAGVIASEREVEGVETDLGEPERVADPNLRTSLAGSNAFTSVSDTPDEDVPAEIQGAVASQKEAAPSHGYGGASNASF